MHQIHITMHQIMHQIPITMHLTCHFLNTKEVFENKLLIFLFYLREFDLGLMKYKKYNF